MKKVNVLYLAIFPLCLALYLMNAKLQKATAFFYGFAENKETELSHDKSVLIHKILVTPGQAVTKGQLLMEVEQASLDYKIDNTRLDLEKLKLTTAQKRRNIQGEIDQLIVERASKVAAVDAKIKALEINIEHHEALLKQLKSLDKQEADPGTSPHAIKLQTLRESRALIAAPINAEIASLRNELAGLSQPSLVEQEMLQKQRSYYETERGKLAIVAPSDGLIGNVLCKEGENISSFTKLINFYERMPTMVKGYVHESLILQVKEGDSLIVSSTLHPKQQIEGEVIGLGTRIVEIPERLRKIPEVKTYGREVLIRIPPSNPFLQKEKVMLNTLSGENFNPFIFFASPQKESKKAQKSLK